MVNTKKICLFTIIGFAVANLFAYLLFHIPMLVLEESFEWLEYTRVFVAKFVEFIQPSVAGTVLFLGYREIGMKKTLLRALYLSLPRIIYLLPYYYVYYIVLSYDSLEAIGLSALVSVFGTVLFFGVSLLLFYIIRVFARMPIIKELKLSLPVNQRTRTPRDAKKKLIGESEQILSEKMCFGSAFDFKTRENLGIFSAVFTVFSVELIREIVESVIFIIECEGILFLDEIIYMTACYLFLLTELIIGQAICSLIKNAALKTQNQENLNKEI